MRKSRERGLHRKNSPADDGYGRRAGRYVAQPLKETYAEVDMDGRDQLRTGQRAGQALQRGVQEDRALPPAARDGRRSHTAEARLPRRRRGGRVRPDREGLRDHARPVRRRHPRGARGDRAAQDEDDRHRGLRRPRGHRPDLLRPSVLPAAGHRSGQAVQAARDRNAGLEQGRHRARRDPPEGAARGDPPDGRHPHHGDDELRRRGDPARPLRRGAGRRRRHEQARGRHGAPADRVAGGRVRPVEVHGHLPRAGARADRAQGGGQGDRRPADGRAAGGSRPDGRARGERERSAPEPRVRRPAERQRRRCLEVEEVVVKAEGETKGEGEDLTLRFEDGALLLLDQTKLPNEECWLRLTSAAEVADAIRRLAVRGAPAIGLAAAYGLALEQMQGRDVAVAAELLRATRPTAVNLGWAIDRALAHEGSLVELAGAMAADQLDQDLRIGEHGAGLMPEGARVITHCNAGPLATGGAGTAGAAIEAGWRAGHVTHVWVEETRPLLQGSRLTAWELGRAGIPFEVVTDSAAGTLMSRGLVDAAIVGADRIAANRDVANKLGTYPLAVLAARHGVPFYVAAPESTIDAGTPSGEAIPIEERAATEITER